MPPRRDTSGDAAMAALIAQQIVAILPTLVTQMNQANANVNQGNNPPPYNFKSFNSCHPPKFLGNEGATGLLQWFESIESTFVISDCPDNLRVRYASCVLQKRALTWWNNEKRTRGTDAALSLSWDEFKKVMTEEFCPRNEVKKLETEFWNLIQISGDNLTYTTRFHELSILVPHMVTPLSRAIEKYINGLPMPIQDTVLGSKPLSVEEAIRLAATLSDNHVKAGTLNHSDNTSSQHKSASSQPIKETSAETSTAPKPNHRKRKSQNFAVITPATPINQFAPPSQTNKKPYTGNHPLCTTCQFHHPTTMPCRLCTICGRYGHTQNYCKNAPQSNQPNQPLAIVPANGRSCYECGDPTHFRNQCPKLIIVNQGARGRAFNINTQDAQANNNEL